MLLILLVYLIKLTWNAATLLVYLIKLTWNAADSTCISDKTYMECC